MVDRAKIAKKYLLGRFWLDFLTILPAKWLITDSRYLIYARMIGMLKVTRVLRISDLISYLNIHESVKMNLKLLQQVFFLILYVHCISCGWFYITKVTNFDDKDDKWVPPLDYPFVGSDLYERDTYY